jgi:hypothetical protein
VTSDILRRKREVSAETKKYLCPYCSETLTTFEALKGHVLQEHKTEPLPAPEGLIKLTVNGQAFELKVEPEWTLYALIHDKLGLTGVKMFCDRGACGSCTVIMDGRPILSCMTLAVECDGKAIETAEGIAEAKHPLVESLRIPIQRRRTSGRPLGAICAGAGPILSIPLPCWKRPRTSRRTDQDGGKDVGRLSTTQGGRNVPDRRRYSYGHL